MATPSFAPADDELTAPFWRAAAEGRLALPRCPVCARWQWYPVEGLACHPDQEMEWVDVAGDGRVWTFTVVERAFLPSGGDPPFTVALIELDDAPGPLLVTTLVGPGRENPSIGERVRLSPTPCDTHVLPTFALVPPGDSGAAH